MKFQAIRSPRRPLARGLRKAKTLPRRRSDSGQFRAFPDGTTAVTHSFVLAPLTSDFFMSGNVTP